MKYWGSKLEITCPRLHTQWWMSEWRCEPNSFWLQSPNPVTTTTHGPSQTEAFYEGYCKHKISQAQYDFINVTRFREIGFTDFKTIAQINECESQVLNSSLSSDFPAALSFMLLYPYSKLLVCSAVFWGAFFTSVNQAAPEHLLDCLLHTFLVINICVNLYSVAHSRWLPRATVILFTLKTSFIYF